jgi:hypothetical protein
MRANRFSKMSAAMIGTALLWVASGAPASAGTGWFEGFVNELHDAADMKTNMQGVKFVVGNDIWQAGREFKSGPNWLALACGPKECTLQPASLTVRPKARKGADDVRPSAGQQLAFRLSVPSKSTVVAWFSTAAGSPAWVKPGAVATYYSGNGRSRPTGKGSFEARIDGAEAVLVPLALSPKYSPGLARIWDTSSETPAYFLQLRAGGKRQLLPGQLGACSQQVSTEADYLLWSGDLDGDGKPDFLINFDEGDGGQQHLYLSGSARPGQIVGLAGQHRAPALEIECDNEAWPL